MSDERLAKVAAKQHGVFSLAQAVAAGFTEKAIRVRVAAGRWVRLHRGTYAIAGTPPTVEQRIIAAVLSLGPRAAAASVTAAWLHGLVAQPGDVVYVAMPSGQHRRTRKGLLIVEAALARNDVRTINSIRVTAPNRTMVDLAGVLSRRALEAALDNAVLLGLTTVPAVKRYIAERRLGHRPGAKTLRALLEDRTKGVPESELERMFLRKLRAARLPEPVRQHRVGTRRVDFAFPRERVAVELDGRAFHSSGDAFRDDPRRRNELLLAGWLPFHFTWDDIETAWPTTEAVLRGALGLTESS